METCSHEDCSLPIYCKGLCSKHYNKAHRKIKAEKKALSPKECAFCGSTFIPSTQRATLCSPRCNQELWRQRQREAVERPSERACVQCGALFAPVKLWAEDDPYQRGRFCSRECKQKARSSTPEQKAIVLARYYVRKYGITQDEAIEMRKGGCAICGRMSQEGRWDNGNLMIDHCHKTGKVRGVLCHSCNVLIGHAGDDPARLEAAATYLRHDA